jgi:hypothetical protein
MENGDVDCLDNPAAGALMARNATEIQSATLLKDNWRTYWTRTVWTDQAAMRMFMASGNHRRAMPNEGRPSKVHHPSAAQAAFQIPAPQVRPFAQITFVDVKRDSLYAR